jgi:hypothetical protein
MRVLVVHMAGLGDLVVAVPAVRALARGWQDGQVEFAGDLDPCQVIEMAGLGLVTHRLDESPWRGLWDYAEDPGRVDVGRWDVVLELWTAGGRLDRYRAATGGRALGLPPDPGSYVDGPMFVRAHKWVCREFGLDVDLADPKLDAGQDRRADVQVQAKGRGVNPPYVVLGPGAGTAYKCWGEPSWWELGRRLRRSAGVQVVAVLGPREKGRGVVVPQHVADWTVSEWEIADVSALIGGAACYVGNDSGLSHVAVWTDTPGRGRTPCVLAFARLNARNWSVRRPWVTNLEFNCARAWMLSVETMYNEVCRRI